MLACTETFWCDRRGSIRPLGFQLHGSVCTVRDEPGMIDNGMSTSRTAGASFTEREKVPRDFIVLVFVRIHGSNAHEHLL